MTLIETHPQDTSRTHPGGLFTGYRLGGLTLPNRVVMAPMTRARAAAGGWRRRRWRRTTPSGRPPGSS